MSDYKELIKKLRQSAQGRKHFCTNHGTNVTPNYIRFMFEAADAIEQLVKERDAIYADMKTLCTMVSSICDICKNNGEIICEECKCTDWFDFWEWRGVQEDNDEID